MYSQEAILTVVNRVGWSAPTEMTSIALTAENSRSDSGRFFNSFHALMTPGNVLDTMPDPTTDNDVLNDFLFSIKKQAVLQVFSFVFDQNERAYWTDGCCGGNVDISGTDYSDMIITKSSVFDQAYGLQATVTSLQNMISTARSNRNERVIKESIPTIEAALNGYYDAEGKQVVKGLNGQLHAAINKAIDILFPKERKEKQPIIRNRTNIW